MSSRVSFIQFVFWNIHTFFSSHFYFLFSVVLFVLILSLLLLAAVISISLLILILFTRLGMATSTLSSLASPLPYSFLDIYGLSLSSLKWKALCISINFLVPWCSCLSSLLLPFKMALSILRTEPPRCLTIWWDFCCRVWFQEVFLLIWDTFFSYFFIHLRLLDGFRFHFSQLFVIFLFY